MFANNRHTFYRWVRSLFTAVAGITAIGVFHIWSSVPDDDDGSTAITTIAQVPALPFDVTPATSTTDQDTSQSPPLTALSTVEFPAAVQELIDPGNYKQARALLLTSAGQAVDTGDEKSLAQLLAAVGELSLIEEDIDSAEVYLSEALEMYELLDEPMAVASVHGQIGRLHLLVRERARRAANAYDTLLVARWKISQGLFYSAESDLRHAAESNMELKRYGAAASAYETLYRGYMQVSDHHQAELAGIEAIKLHASSGRMFDAEALQQKMLAQGISPVVFENLVAELEQLNDEFEASVKAIGTARDQAQLYNQLKARGDVVTAWRFRQQSNESLANASTRAQYRRQPDVLAELYRSNSSMKNAHDSLQKASELYHRYGVDTSELQALRKLVY